MIGYIFRRIVYGFFILLGVNALTFALFFAVNTPDDMARLSIGGRYVTQQAIDSWKKERGYDVPLIFNSAAEGTGKFTETIFFRRSAPLLAGDFGLSDTGRSINTEIKERAPASLALALRLEWAGVAMSVTVMSISALFYIIVGQWLFSKTLRWVPVSGFSEGFAMAAFLVLPVAIGVFTRLGGEALLYRSMFLEESEKDYVRTARAKGVSEMRVLFRHVLGNAMLPVITSTVAVIPMLFMGSLIMENFFGIPGLGSYTIDAINAQDFSVVRAMVFLGTAAYILGLILTDVAYTVVDPRIRLK